MAIPQTFIQELIARADVVEVVGRHVQLKKTGANFSGLCPFHNEKSPSFTVSPTKQFFHCFGCGKNGNAIGFLMEHTGAGFVDAVKDLAQQYGLQVPEDERSPADRERAAEMREKQVTLVDVMHKAAEAWRGHLKNSPRAVDYLKKRGLSGEIARDFGLGYAPDGWRGLASVFPDYADPLLVEGGLVIEHEDEAGEVKRYDRFRDRIMFPIRNVKGECIAFGGRVLDAGEPKYLNSPETPLFHKGRELYGLFEARSAVREAGFVLVTEGYMDVVALAQLGFANAVATLGTACTAEHVHKLFRHTDGVVFSFDGDAAGRRAARRALEASLPFAGDTRSIKFLFLPAEHDPDSFIRAHGRDAFARCIGDAMPLSRFLVESARDGCDLSSAEGRARLASQAQPLWSALPDGAFKRQLLGELAELIALDARELASLWRGAEARALPAAGAPRSGGRERERAGVAGAWPRAARSAPTSRADHAVRLLLAHSAAWSRLSDEEHALLCALPEPHGALLGWLDGQWHEHGPQPWAALREGLAGQSFEAHALRLMQPLAGAAGPDDALADEGLEELRDVVQRLVLDALETERADLSARLLTDPAALARYRQVDERWKLLKRSLAT